MKLNLWLKYIVSAAICASLLSGCSIADFGTDNLLRPPKSMGSEAEIEQLIAYSTHNKYTLKYPKNGSSRSAITMCDLDADGVNEAVAFCRENDNATSIHMLVMYCDNNKWMLSSDNVTEAANVDCIDFADIDGNGTLEILSGYSTYAANVNILSCHSYSNGKTSKVQAEQSYSSFYCGDFNNDGDDEIITLMLCTAENEASASMLDYNAENKIIHEKARVAMDPGVVRVKKAEIADYNNTTAVVVDGFLAADEINTQIIYYSTELSLLRNPLYNDKKTSFTQRSLDISSIDINGDKSPELPSVEKLKHPDEIPSDRVADLIEWYSFVPEDETTPLAEIDIAQCSLNFSFTIPEGWSSDNVTAVCSEDNNALEFYEWNKSKLGKKLFEIRFFNTADWDMGKNSEGYTLITKANSVAYALKNENSDSPLSLEDNDIKTAFSVLTEATV